MRSYLSTRNILPFLILNIAVGTAVAQDRPRPAEIEPLQLKSELRIINGQPAEPGQIPWQVSMQIRIGESVFLCGGSVVRSGWVLTAAHCVEKQEQVVRPALVPASDINVRSASIFVDRNGLAAQANSVFVMNERNAETSAFDVALVKVDTHADATPIALQASLDEAAKDPIKHGATLQVSGFGTTETGGTSPKLLYADVAFVRSAICNSPQSYGGRIDGSMLCAGKLPDTRPTDSCQGDSGGPLYKEASEESPATLIGVVSWGRGCALPDYPGVYAKVANPSIAEWIAKTMAEN